MNNEPNKPAELTEKELEGVVGGAEQASPVRAPQWTVIQAGVFASTISAEDRRAALLQNH